MIVRLIKDNKEEFDPCITFYVPYHTPAEERQQQPKDADSTNNEPFRIALIVPAYAESGKTVQQVLEHALQHADAPEQIQVNIIDTTKTTTPGKIIAPEFSKTKHHVIRLHQSTA